ncbi:NAD(P)-binding protein [Polyplosphaeria fusca]|uniref:NAD(P)-binding protein n=1 Tax=Polyplosphaeria fusca TaxID=682080 RepID=A0A9P4QWQ9_9PLEO|nr:NAD(P)-binding protein [Polyplosphaeria fusca]
MPSPHLPPTHRALMQHVYAQPLTVEQVPTPQISPGSAVLRIESAGVISYSRDVYDGTRRYPYPTPLVIGLHAVGRIVALGADAVALKIGMLVFFDSFIRARDDPSVVMLSGFSEVGKAHALMSGEWRDSTYAQFAKVPLENCHPLDEERLCGPPMDGGLGYSKEQLTWIGMALVAYGGLRTIGLQVGETVVVAPATGGFGGAGVLVALAMGAKVIAMGRNKEILDSLSKLSPRVRIVPLAGDAEHELEALTESGPVDAYLDMSPPTASNSTYRKTAIKALRNGGRISLMGGLSSDNDLPLFDIAAKNLTLQGKLMYDFHHIRDMIKLIEGGMLSLDPIKVAGKFGLEQWEEAFGVAAGMKYNEVTVLSGWGETD